MPISRHTGVLLLRASREPLINYLACHCEDTRKEEHRGIYINYFIRIELHKDASPPTLTIRGEDMELVGGAAYIKDDIKAIAEAVRGCCAAPTR